MKKMPNTDKQERVSALFADSDRGQCSAIRLYGSAQQAVEVCAAVTTGQQVLEILRSGLCPQVLVLDTLLQGARLWGNGSSGSWEHWICPTVRGCLSPQCPVRSSPHPVS